MKKCKTTYYGGLFIDHKTKEAILPDGTRRPIKKKEITEMKRREKLLGCK